MERVKIPFLPSFREKMLSGRKTCTSRTSRMAFPEDNFEAFGATFEVVKVERMRVGDMIAKYQREEGFDTFAEFIKIWNRLHPFKNYDVQQVVYVHHFKKVS